MCGLNKGQEESRTLEFLSYGDYVLPSGTWFFWGQPGLGLISIIYTWTRSRSVNMADSMEIKGAGFSELNPAFKFLCLRFRVQILNPTGTQPSICKALRRTHSWMRRNASAVKGPTTE